VDGCLETVIRDPALYILCMCHLPNLMPLFHSLGCLFKESAQVQCLHESFIRCYIFVVRCC
jgi:hypothetical protein